MAAIHIRRAPREGQTDHNFTFCGRWIRGLMLDTQDNASCKTCIKREAYEARCAA